MQMFVEPAVTSVLEKKIVVTSCITSKMLLGCGQHHFTHILVDEASQSLEPEIYIPLSLATSSTCVVCPSRVRHCN